MQVSRSPTARWTSAAATAESTPPDSAQMTSPSEPVARGVGVDALADLGDGRVDEVGRRPGRRGAGDADDEVAQDVPAARRVDDLGVELDAVQVAVGVDEAGERRRVGLGGRRGSPRGRRVIESPWLIQTGCSRSRPAKRPSSAVIVTVAGPYSRFAAGSTSPPSSWAISWAP